jgi:hypothetical protein
MIMTAVEPTLVRPGPRPVQRSRHPARALSAAAALLLAACGDLPMSGGDSGRTMSRIEIEVPDPFVVGDTVPLRFRALDQNSEAFSQLPPWLVGTWSANTPLMQVDGARARALEVGTTSLRVDAGGFTSLATIRISPASMAVGIPGAYITQGIQRFDGNVPLVANRTGYMRVFVVGGEFNFFRPRVLAHFFRGGQRIETLVAEPSQSGIPLQLNEGQLAWSWNVTVPASLIAPGTSYRVEIDPEYNMRAAPGSTLVFPAVGQRPMNVVAVPPFNITFVPIRIIGFATGNVTAANVEQYMEASRQVWPLGGVDVTVREPYSTETQSSTAEDWSALLREIRNLRIADGSTRYYHGILRRQGGWAGLAYVGYPVGITYDALPAANWTVAHELGHNFNRRHAPCGNPSGVDQAYPYDGAITNWYGITADGATLEPPTRRDLMSYCSPRWISDYTFEAALAFRTGQAAGMAGQPLAAPAELLGAGTQDSPGPALIVSGVAGSSGIRLDPAFTVSTLPSLPRTGGPYTLEAFDAAGATLFSIAFAGEETGEDRGDDRDFAFAIPMTGDVAARIARLRVRGNGRSAERVSSVGAAMRATLQGPLGQGLGFTARAMTADRVDVRWDQQRFPLVVVRNPATGAIIAMLRNGTSGLASDARELEFHFSDGVSSINRRIRVQNR